MKQHNIFSTQVPEKHSSEWVVYIDGAARNNPGPAGAGIFMLKDGQTVSKEGFYLGNKTNNQAEYLALLLALYFLKRYMHEGDSVRIVSDSELLVKQLNGVYKVRHPFIKPLYECARALLPQERLSIMHVVRSDNVQADKLANVGIDKKNPLPEQFIAMLEQHGISLTFS